MRKCRCCGRGSGWWGEGRETSALSWEGRLRLQLCLKHQTILVVTVCLSMWPHLSSREPAAPWISGPGTQISSGSAETNQELQVLERRLWTHGHCSEPGTLAQFLCIPRRPELWGGASCQEGLLHFRPRLPISYLELSRSSRLRLGSGEGLLVGGLLLAVSGNYTVDLSSFQKEENCFAKEKMRTNRSV